MGIYYKTYLCTGDYDTLTIIDKININIPTPVNNNVTIENLDSFNFLYTGKDLFIEEVMVTTYNLNNKPITRYILIKN